MTELEWAETTNYEWEVSTVDAVTNYTYQIAEAQMQNTTISPPMSQFMENLQSSSIFGADIVYWILGIVFFLVLSRGIMRMMFSFPGLPRRRKRIKTGLPFHKKLMVILGLAKVKQNS